MSAPIEAPILLTWRWMYSILLASMRTGIEATNEILSLCHIEDAHEVLNAGGGIGVRLAYIAKRKFAVTSPQPPALSSRIFLNERSLNDEHELSCQSVAAGRLEKYRP